MKKLILGTLLTVSSIFANNLDNYIKLEDFKQQFFNKSYFEPTEYKSIQNSKYLCLGGILYIGYPITPLINDYDHKYYECKVKILRKGSLLIPNEEEIYIKKWDIKTKVSDIKQNVKTYFKDKF